MTDEETKSFLIDVAVKLNAICGVSDPNTKNSDFNVDRLGLVNIAAMDLYAKVNEKLQELSQ